MSVRRRYGLVRAIAFVLKLLGWIALVLGIVSAILVLTNLNANAPAFVRVLGSVGLVAGPLIGIIWWVQLYAFGSVLSILVDIEENTRLLGAEPQGGVTIVETP